MKKGLLFLLLFILIFPGYSAIKLNTPENLSGPTYREFSINREFINPLNYKKITVAEYVTDPLILYATLWGCFFTTLPVWENNIGQDGMGYMPNDPNFWIPDIKRGFVTDSYLQRKYVKNGDESVNEAFTRIFGNRLVMEPFATGRIDPVTKIWITESGEQITVLRNDLYAKNLIEPAYFTYMTLYMRAKNYHPAIIITEIIMMSVLYEFTIRPFYMNSSFEQFLKNPAVGLVLGILFDEISTFLLTTPHRGLHVLAYFFNPFNALPNARIKPLLFFDPFQRKVRLETVIPLD